MTPDENKKLVQQMFDELMNAKNFSAIDKYIASGYVNHGIPISKTGPEGFKEALDQFTNGFPNMHVYAEQVIAEGDTVTTRGYWTGTHKGNFMNIPATNKQVRVDYIDVWKIQNGKAVENWVQMDGVGMMQQLGVMPAPSTQS